MFGQEPQAPKLQSSSIEAEPVDTPKIAAEQDLGQTRVQFR